ncbi:hypothetical protein BGX31_004058, partial [Mortierella sp. GBA43]
MPSAPAHHSMLDSWILSLFSSSDDAIIACDLHGTVCAWNQGAQHIFGLPAKQSIGKDLNILFPHDHTLAYPTSPDSVRALDTSPVKRLVSRTVRDCTQHQFLESISPIHHHDASAHLAAVAAPDANNNHTHTGNGSANGVHVHIEEENGTHHSHTESPAAAAASPVVGYSVILTDLSTLSTLPMSPLGSPPQLPSSATISPLAPLPSSLPTSSLPAQTPEIALPAAVWIPVDSSPAPSISPSISPFQPTFSAATAYMSPAAEEEDLEESSFNFSDAAAARPAATRVYSADSGFDERSPNARTMSGVSLVGQTSIIPATAAADSLSDATPTHA